MSTEVENTPAEMKEEKENIPITTDESSPVESQEKPSTEQPSIDQSSDDQSKPTENADEPSKNEEEGNHDDEASKTVQAADDKPTGIENVQETDDKDSTPTNNENVPPPQDVDPTSVLTPAQMEGVPKELLVKHPLQYRWALWYCKQDRSKDWEECLKQVASFDTVEDFWALYNNVQLASNLSWGSDYYLFKEGIRPMWEDPHNIDGGRWLIQVEKTRRGDLLDHYWLELLMAVIGEQFDDHGDHICGLVINVRQKGDKISLWTRDAQKEEVNRRIGQVAKQKLTINDFITYEQHKDTSHKSSSNVKARLRI